MTRDEQIGIIAGIAVAAAMCPNQEIDLRRLADALQAKWTFGPDEFVHHEFLCAELAEALPRKH